MMLVKCHLGRSRIEGLGVFAGESIAAGAQVWRFERSFDVLVPAAELDRAPEPVRAFFARFAYEMPIYPGHFMLDGDDGRFMNHSEKPNIDLSHVGVATARRDIAIGEEMTCDYRLLTRDELQLEPPRPAF